MMPFLQISVRPQVTLTFDVLTHKVDRFMPLCRRSLTSVGIKIDSFFFEVPCSQFCVTDERTHARTTKSGKVENIMPRSICLSV